MEAEQQGGIAPATPTPSVGRIVHWIGGSMGPEPRGEEGQRHPAIVTRVWGPDLVNLIVFIDGVTSPMVRTSAELGVHWEWPPRV